uniref:hypothetical protein n=1 Tax=Legionella waltersii TaxID=66969 RepID=UPI0038BD89D1
MRQPRYAVSGQHLADTLGVSLRTILERVKSVCAPHSRDSDLLRADREATLRKRIKSANHQSIDELKPLANALAM